MTSENFEFEGFIPTDDLKSRFKEVMWLVEDRAPSQSAKRAAIKKTEDGFLGEMKVSSTAGVFSVEAHSQAAEEVVEDLYRKIRSLLTSWSKGRDIS